MKVNLGCGKKIKEGWLNIDLISTGEGVLVYDIKKGLPFPDSSVEEILLQEVIEHLSVDEAKRLAMECYRVLMFGGKLTVTTPDFKKVMEHWESKAIEWRELCALLFGYYASTGSRENEGHMYHKMVFDEDTLMKFFNVGFKDAVRIHDSLFIPNVTLKIQFTK